MHWHSLLWKTQTAASGVKQPLRLIHTRSGLQIQQWMVVCCWKIENFLSLHWRSLLRNLQTAVVSVNRALDRDFDRLLTETRFCGQFDYFETWDGRSRNLQSFNCSCTCSIILIQQNTDKWDESTLIINNNMSRLRERIRRCKNAEIPVILKVAHSSKFIEILKSNSVNIFSKFRQQNE